MKAESAIGTGADWREALGAAVSQLPMLGEGGVDLALLFASPEYASAYGDLIGAARSATGARNLIGCSGQGVIGRDREVEDEPAIALLAFSLPGADLRALRLTQADVADEADPPAWLLDAPPPGATNAWLIFADPFSFDAEALLQTLWRTYGAATPLIGGLASGHPRRRGTHVFLDGEAFDGGAVALAIGGPYGVKTVVSQGAEPIGETWTITAAQGNYIETIGMRPALEVLAETLHALPEETRERASRNLLVGLAMNEYKDEFRRGDFLIRNLLGVDQQTGTIAVGAVPSVGQTLQFQMRDPTAADDDLVQLLRRAREELGGLEPVGALLCSCNGRGIGLFGRPDHDARTLSEQLGPLPVAGFFCNGEIGPIGGRPFVHGFTASIALIVPK